ncbi:hypothetical protein GF352_01715|nr:hypothetical protein [archaeon]
MLRKWLVVFDVLSVGNANVDLIINSNNLKTNEEFITRAGGSACNFAVGCSRLGLEAAFLGFIGRDSFAERVVDSLESEGVKPLVKRVPEHTGFVVVFTRKRFKKFFKYPGANTNLEGLRLKSYFNKAEHLHLATPPLSLLKQVKGSVSVDPGSTISKYKLDELKPYLKNVKVFFPNVEEARSITGLSYKRAAQALVEAGVEVVVVKRGRYGCYLRTKDESFKTKSLDYPVTDTTGAGDAFASAFISAHLKGKSLKEACRWGIISSNICVTKLGARNSATISELNELL